MKTARKGRRDSYISIRSKLVAAVAMLLVASFMVVSSSYAWFTLSTAPEITGIQTAVGANGNLEIALVRENAEGTRENITSAVGDATRSDSYYTWGNLVDLSNGGFGLEQIRLMPSRLHVAQATADDGEGAEGSGAGVEVVSDNPLQTPVYSYDGRISALNAGTLTGSYHTDSFTSTTPANGVRAIGNATSMTQQQIDFRAAQTNAGLAIKNAQSSATRSLKDAGNDLATIAAAHATAGSGDSNQYDITFIDAMLTKLETTVEELDKAVLNFLKAKLASTSGSLTSEQYDTLKTESGLYVDDTTTIDLATLVSNAGVSALTDAWQVRTYVNNAVTAARAKYTDLGTGASTASWSDTTSTLAGLVDLTSVKINGINSSEIKDKLGELASSILGGSGIIVTLAQPATRDTTTGYGVFCELALLTGNFSVPVVIEKIEYAGAPLENLKATMKTEMPASSMINMIGAIPAAPTGSSESASIINDLYGYVIDLAFRTNAADSHLLLQTAAANRIYSGNQATDTMGHGSTMTFDVSEELSEEQIKNLLKAIRIVFTENNKIVAVAGPNADTADLASDTVTVDVELYDAATYEFTLDENNNGQFVAKTGDGVPKFVDATKTAPQLITLTQNQVHYLSVYVYLDGDSVTNSDVAASAIESMSGSLNLQFSSDANLIPMDYSPLKNTQLENADTPEENP